MPHLTKELRDEKAVGDCLRRLIAEMDDAIAQAIENPLLFLDGPFLSAIESSCASLAAIEEHTQISSVAPVLLPLPRQQALLSTGQHVNARQAEKAVADPEPALSALIWEVRGRAGRLQRLLDSASQFYSTCFSPRKAECLDYGVHGEWGPAVNPSHLAIDC
jgi:hypothetical protein